MVKEKRLATIFNSQKVSVEEMDFRMTFCLSRFQRIRTQEVMNHGTFFLEMKTLQASDSRGSATRCPKK